MIAYACSTNQGKVREFRLCAQGCSNSGIDIEPLPGIEGVPPPEETGASFEENAALKAGYYSGFTSELVFADDSGLEVEALGGAPGVYSARYAGPNATDAANNALLIQRLASTENHSARFVCLIAVAQHGRVLETFRGTVEGRIRHHARGTGGFGYDPLFFYPPFGRTLAEAAAEEKLAVSHRGKALRAMIAWLAKRT